MRSEKSIELHEMEEGNNIRVIIYQVVLIMK